METPTDDTQPASASLAFAVHAVAPSAEPSIGRELLGGVVGAGVALVCFLPPLIHFVSGPFGPAIGGFVAAQWIRPGNRGRAVIAITLGATLAGLGGVVAFAIVRSGAPSWFPSTDALGAILGGVAAYSAMLGAIGASFGVRFADRRAVRA